MIIALLVVGTIFYALFQTREKNARKWARRVQAWAPLGRHLRADIRATVLPIRSFFTIRQYRKTNRTWENPEEWA